MRSLRVMGMSTALGAGLLAWVGVAEAKPIANVPWASSAARLPRAFAHMDNNRDQRVSRFEYRAAASRDFIRWMNRVDRDRNGFFTRSELKWAQRTAPSSSVKRALTRIERGAGRDARAAGRDKRAAGHDKRAAVPMWRLWSAHLEDARTEFRRLDRNRDRSLSPLELRRLARLDDRHQRRNARRTK